MLRAVRDQFGFFVILMFLLVYFFSKQVVGGGKNIRSASRMNKAIVVFLSETAMVDSLIEEGLVIKD